MQSDCPSLRIARQVSGSMNCLTFSIECTLQVVGEVFLAEDLVEVLPAPVLDEDLKEMEGYKLATNVEDRIILQGTVMPRASSVMRAASLRVTL